MILNKRETIESLIYKLMILIGLGFFYKKKNIKLIDESNTLSLA